MQSSNLEAAKKARDAFSTEYEREAFASGYDHAHGIACHNVPTIGETIWLDGEGRVTVDAENIADTHRSICFEAESNARCFSPWEYTANEINSLDEKYGEGATESAWDAYEEGVSLAIDHDLEGYEYEVTA